MDRLASTTAFVKAAEVGSFAAAASALRMSPQMIAKHVTWLESRLGARLLNRTTRWQSLTDIGKAYYDRCKLVLGEADWADSLADEAKGAPRGCLRVNAPVSFGAHSLTPVIARYLRQYSKVEVDLVLNDRLVDLVEEEFEAVFRIGPLADSSFVLVNSRPFALSPAHRPITCAKEVFPRRRSILRRTSVWFMHRRRRRLSVTRALCAVKKTTRST
jgi:DNA-binding transcriptional LysR family regulator